MASFKTHVSFGTGAGIIACVVAFFYSVAGSDLILAWIFFSIFVGSVLPDIDSDEGTPLRIVFLIFGSVAAGAGLIYALQNHKDNLYYLAGIPLGIFVLIRFAGPAVFKKYTRHRGMLHSIPVALIFVLLVFIIADSFSFGQADALLIALGVGAGYFLHLLLDEIKSTVNFNGVVFSPKKSLGSALKLFSRSLASNLFAYSVLILLIIYLYPAFTDLYASILGLMRFL